jgi:hypothetical protein
MTRPPDPPDHEWEPYLRPPKDRLRITETSCCGAFEWACQGGQYLILRRTSTGRYEETARGLYQRARRVWHLLLALHEDEHQREARTRVASHPRQRGRALPRKPAA